MQLSKDIGFHESTIIGIRHDSDRLVIDFEEVRVGECKKLGSLHVSGVKDLQCDGFDAHTLQSEYEDGEVLSLELKGDKLLLFVEWNDFANHISRTRSYTMSCESIDFQLH